MNENVQACILTCTREKGFRPANFRILKCFPFGNLQRCQICLPNPVSSIVLIFLTSHIPGQNGWRAFSCCHVLLEARPKKREAVACLA
eukprot:1157817-Pelagomonas_calceolata.AAC.1